MQVAEAEKWLSSPLDVSSKLHGKLTTDYITCTSILRGRGLATSPVYLPAEERSAGGSDTATGDHAIFDYFTGLLQSEENLAKV